MWGEQWVCGCTWSNIIFRKTCRNCGEPRKPDARLEGPFEIMTNVELANVIERKRNEIEAANPGVCRWDLQKTPTET